MRLLETGKFTVGCNYWASHAGTNMWRDWRPDIIEADFAKLSAHNVRMLRVFPLWPDFQPIHIAYAGGGAIREYRFGEDPLPDTPEGQAGVSEEALQKFQVFCDLARKYDIQLIVGLVTGWMSGRLYAPPALQGLNLLTDPTAIMWETRYVRCFVNRFRNEASITAWDLGNECNCLAGVSSAAEFYTWTASITGAIRTCDHSRPIISGMHGLLPEGNWQIGNQAELTDILTTHPYPLFTPYCDAAPINTLRTVMHSTAQTLFYRGIGAKPCFVEEAGTLGNMLGDEQTVAAYVRSCLYSLWAHDCRGYLWWCANEQTHLTHAPYDWNAVERELGLFRQDGSPKPVIQELENFSRFLEPFEHTPLPGRIVDAVCVLSPAQDCWANAYMSFTLGKQAGLDMEFAYSRQPLPEANCYLLPGLTGDSSMDLHRIRELLHRVENGAVLYLSLDNALISAFEQITGMHVTDRRRVDCTETMCFDQDGETFELPLQLRFRLNMHSTGAQVIGTDGKGLPVCSVYPYGKGKVMLLACPLEDYLAHRPDRMEADPPYYRIYEILRSLIPTGKAARINQANVGLTEHIAEDTKRILVLINHDPEPVQVDLQLADGWKISRFLKGSLSLPGNDAAVAEIITK